MPTETRGWIVSGRVQGVFFRASTRTEARRLGLSGHALNRADGTVEVVASGTLQSLDALETWLHHGPPGARVDAVRLLPDPGAVESAAFTVG